MPVLYTICSISYFVTIVLYVTIYFGFMAQFFLGCIHLLSALGLYLNYRDLTKMSRKKLNTYGLMVVAYFVVLLLLTLFFKRFLALIGVFYLSVVPMAIGGYFTHILHQHMRFREFKNKPYEINL